MEGTSNLVLPKEDNSKFFKSNESDSFIDDGNGHPNLSQIIPSKDPNTSFALNPREKSEIPLDPTVDFLRRYLLEEDLDGKISGYEEEALRDMEKPFYDILGEKYPPSQDNQSPTNPPKKNLNFTRCTLIDQVGPIFNESLKQHSMENVFATEFQKGAEEGMKFLPDIKKLSVDLEVSKISLDPMKNCDNFRLVEEKGGLLDKSKGKKSTNDADLNISGGRNRKILMVSCEETIRDEIFDKVLLNHGENFEREDTTNLSDITEHKASSKNQNQYSNLNIKDLLISCAEAISMNNSKVAVDLINQIRKQASPLGDGIQRLACVIADGLEARLAGTGSSIYRQLVARRVSATDFLKAYQMCMSGSPIKRVAYHFANKNILSAVGTASKIHIVDFGIAFGFQWPSLIQALARMKGGIPKLRITGVDLPQMGFHPDGRVKETGKRLEDYARDFKVSFEYHGIASQWESICLEDFSIRDDEAVIVNSMYNLSRLRDEPLVGMKKSKNQLLKLIRAMKPKVFIQGIINLSFSPFFIPRFRMVLQQYFRYFDMLDALVPRNSKPRQLMERELFGPPIINQIACEGSDLVAIPENYKQCHIRNLETGFEQLLVDPSVLKECCKMVRNGYNNAFFVEEDCNWFLQGFKGNIFYAVSLWKPQVE
ncbi:hypothetical protein LUZ61_019351 [Rhynchospora tenuis]|uniref:Uncharacterized protein n=1 Tax=Rhynchospora tenuis TaxID=198213 RepID=A0AAD5ZAZ6_9POAL|nr:hypothetical protein LUZ61_019351 [Rhynchospora tenuis]